MGSVPDPCFSAAWRGGWNQELSCTRPRDFFSEPGRLKGMTMSKKLYVGNLSFNTTSDDLRQAFSQYGSVDSASVVTDRDTGRSRGFGFVEMSEGADAAVQGLNGTDLQGRTLTVNEAKPREERGGSRGGGPRRARY